MLNYLYSYYMLCERDLKKFIDIRRKREEQVKLYAAIGSPKNFHEALEQGGEASSSA